MTKIKTLLVVAACVGLLTSCWWLIKACATPIAPSAPCSHSVNANGTAEVEIENFSNDQVSALREANKLLENANKLKSP